MKEFEIASARKLAVLAAYSTDVGREPFPYGLMHGGAYFVCCKIEGGIAL